MRQLFFILLFPIYSSAQIGSGVNDTASSRIKNDYMRILNFGGENDRYIANKEKKVKVYLKGNRSLKTIAQIYCKYSRSDTLPIFVELSSFGLGECVEYAALAPDVANSRKTKVSGNVLYELSYLSHRDTPFLEKNIFHHRIQTHLDILVKNEYPLRISFNTQFSNSGFFRPLSDINIGYNPIDIRRLVKEQFTSRLAKTFDFEDLNRLKSAIDSLQQVLSNMDKQLSDPSEIQRLIEEREKSVAMEFEGLPAGKLDRNRLEYNDVGEMRVQSYVDSISILQKSSKVKSLEADYATLLEQREVVAKEVNKLMQLYKEKENIVRNQAQAIERDINKSNDLRALRTRLGEFGVGDSSVPKIYNLLWNIRSFNLGRSLVNYSELSAKNVSITGIQFEYNRKFYYAIASGVIDFRYRDYVMRGGWVPKQFLSLIRFGKGDKEKSNVILTVYSGKRHLFNSAISGQRQVESGFNVFGLTLESQLRINQFHNLTLEVAKSSHPLILSSELFQATNISKAFALEDRSNEAYAFRINSFLPSTRTKINGSYRYFGAAFQSFSLFTTGASQQFWEVRIEQPFFKRQLMVHGAIRNHQMNNPYIEQNFTSNIFKSLQATLRRPKWPVVSIGYQPSSQLTKVSEDRFMEYTYHTLNSSASYFYKVGGNSMNSSVLFTKFFNRSSDTSFLYYNASNLSFNHGFSFGKIASQANVFYSQSSELEIYSIEGCLQYHLSKVFSIGGGAKYNKIIGQSDTYWGYSSNASWRIYKLGVFQFWIDRGFIPGSNSMLMENVAGRFTYSKEF